jgi:hypothetical protein
VSHSRAVVKARKDAAHAAYVAKTYGLHTSAMGSEYDDIYEHQEGRCFICRRATGATRRLAVDHDHEHGWVRGLLCKPCNRMLGHARDDVQFFARAIAYLESPPAQELGIWARPDDWNKP